MLKRLKSPLAIVFCIILIDVLGIGILIPVIPLLLTDPDYAYHLSGITIDQGYVILGLLTAIYPLMQFFATPILGQLSDRIGRRPVLAFSLLGTSLSYVIFALGIITKNIPLLFISRALDGITGGNISVAQAAIVDISTPQNRARSFGVMGAAFGIGFVVGPFLGGKLSDPSILPWFNATTPFWFAAIISLLNALAVFFLFNETLRHKASGVMHWAQALINIKTAFAMRTLRKLFSVTFLFQSGFAFFTTFFGAYLIFKFGFTQGAIGDYFAFVGILIALTQILIVGFVGKRFSVHTIVSVALFGVACTLLAFSLVPEGWMLYLVAIPQAICMGLIMANLNALISHTAPPERQGEILGIAASVQALAQTLPPIAAGYLAAHFSASTPIIAGSALVFLAFLVFAIFVRGTAHALTNHGSPSH